ncbi:GGDEF domain-containing protein [Vibrio aestuarianus]|nr:diguanylate cyclase [Vibrio aestuarianus]MDE1239914.1 GGDEF domain-containing protein [Vibrio aestuarianus]
MRSLAYLDGLTGLNNRRYFDQHLKSHLAQAYRKKQPLSLLLIDIDYFKQYNDTFGHLEGDDCLKKVATALHQCCRRPTDIAARYGGEEFAIILPETSQEGIWHVASLVQDQIKALSIDHPAAENGFLTISIGGGSRSRRYSFIGAINRISRQNALSSKRDWTKPNVYHL